MNVPEYMPVLSAGAHETPELGACIMEMVSFLAGEVWSDSPACTHPVLAEMARCINDRLSDAERQKILPLMGRLFGTAPTGTDHERRVLSVRLAVWCARQVVDLAAGGAALAAIETAERWCDGKATAEECRAATYAAAYVAPAAAEAAYTAYAGAYAACYAAALATEAAANRDVLALLSGLIDEYDRLTGRTEYRQISAADYRALAALTA